jgi:hypothetical protein
LQPVQGAAKACPHLESRTNKRKSALQYQRSWLKIAVMH